MSKHTFHKAEIHISPSAHLEDAYIFRGHGTKVAEFTIRFESEIEDKDGNTHWNTTDVVFSKAQAAEMLRALVTMMSQPDPDFGDITWVVNDQEYKELETA